MNIKNSELKKYLVLFGVAVLSILLIIKMSKFMIFLGLTIISGIIVFVNYYTELPLDISPVFFLSIIITSTYGFHYTIPFVLLAGFIPSVVSRGIGFDCFMYLGVNLLVNFIFTSFSFNSIVIGGIIFSFVYGLLTSAMSAMSGSPAEKEFFFGALTFIINILYFSKIAIPIMSIL